MRISPLAALFLLLPEANLAQNLDDFKEALSSIPPGEVNDPLKSLSTNPALADSFYKSFIDREVCPAFQDDMQNFLDSQLLLLQGYPKFFEPRAFPNGAVFGPGTCTTSYISHERIRQKLEEFPKLFEDGKIYRENSLGLLRLNDLIFKKGVWSNDYAGIMIGAPKEDHDIFRPVVDYLFGDATTMQMPDSPFNGDGNTWSSDAFYQSAQAYLSEKDEVTVGADASAWVIKSFHEQIFGVSLSPEELQLFNTLQGVFVLLSSLPPTNELLYPVLLSLLSSLTQDFVPIALGQLSQRFSALTGDRILAVDRGESMEENEFMALSETVVNLQNAMLGLVNMGDIGDLNAEELISIIVLTLNATKDAYATLYSFAILDGPEPSMARVRSLLHGEMENIVKAGHAVADTFFFAGGLSVPTLIEATAGVYFGKAIEDIDTFDITNDMQIKLLVLEATRRFPPVLGVTYIDNETGQRIAPLPGMAGFDRGVYGEDVMKIKIRGDLQFYHENSLNFAEAAGPLDNKPASSRVCPGRSMSIAMATQFIKAMKLQDYCLADGEKIVFDEGGATYFNEFTVTKKDCDSKPGPVTEDDLSFEFIRPQNGLKGSCAWLLGQDTNPSPPTITSSNVEPTLEPTTKSAKSTKNAKNAKSANKEKSMEHKVKKRLKEFCDLYVMFEEVTNPIKYFCPAACEDYRAAAIRSMLRR